jgi:hypothetical protein
MKNRHGFKCCVCSQPATLHEVAKGRGVRVEYGIRHHLQLPLCAEHHKEAHNVGKRIFEGGVFEIVWFEELYGHGEYGMILAHVNQRNHAELEKTDSDRLKRLMEYCE